MSGHSPTRSLGHPLTPPSHLCSLILVESFDLDFILSNVENRRCGYCSDTDMVYVFLVCTACVPCRAMEDHHLFKSESSTTLQVP